MFLVFLVSCLGSTGYGQAARIAIFFAKATRELLKTALAEIRLSEYGSQNIMVLIMGNPKKVPRILGNYATVFKAPLEFLDELPVSQVSTRQLQIHLAKAEGPPLPTRGL